MRKREQEREHHEMIAAHTAANKMERLESLEE
jgi:hypothetical protein